MQSPIPLSRAGGQRIPDCFQQPPSLPTLLAGDAAPVPLRAEAIYAMKNHLEALRLKSAAHCASRGKTRFWAEGGNRREAWESVVRLLGLPPQRIGELERPPRYFSY